MKAIETLATFDEHGQMTIENLPIIKNKTAKILFLFEDEHDENFYTFSSQGLLRAYSDDEPEYDISLLKEPNPLYKK